MPSHSPRVVRTVLVNAAKNAIYAIPGIDSLRASLLGSPFDGSKVQGNSTWCQRRSEQVEQILDAYLTAWGDVGWLRNRVVVELGSGSDVAMPFCFALLGAAKTFATDVPEIDRIGMPDELRRRVVDLATSRCPQRVVRRSEEAEATISRKSGLRAEQLSRDFNAASVDLIVSTSTLEHVDDPAATVAQMNTILRSGGRMVHAIAFGNHCCGEGEQDRLGHLYYSERVWSMMFSHRVGHNRLRWFEWKRMIEGAGFDVVDCRLTSVPPAEVVAARPNLAARFAVMSDEQLGPSYAVVCCEKKV